LMCLRVCVCVCVCVCMCGLRVCTHMCVRVNIRVGQNHIHIGVYTVLLVGTSPMYDHLQCIYAVLANSTYMYDIFV